MSATLADLTEKEKEALRLLLAGHDAKSSAAQLDLSVHTVNDRLRNARRKLDVSSSREAARILGVAEETAPQNSAHTSFGIADAGDGADTATLNNTEPKRSSGLIWLAGGMLIMSILIAAAIIGVVYSGSEESSVKTEEVASTEATAPQSETASDMTEEQASPAALKRATTFIAAVDALNWEGSWNVAGEFFQTSTSAEEWAELVEPVRKPLGAVSERRLVSVQQVETLPGAPEGDYEILIYQTKFTEVEIISTETIVTVRNGDGFDVAGYFIN
ncbi:helix-turn-helix domain-containing protein [Erythrobacter crassostreae]|uniref:DUF4019 domain-containing protein n=1 Tax=Erythrobacter crassostreae TaxID=2828328 RepID=A0A9X1JN31_9SPHN|nr:DUF4019 domain-containing protein [Erythrobacter crassostrea]MBV7260049.1 DUF4019 domain-containing protein [Erythrobacter crassostrea]